MSSSKSLNNEFKPNQKIGRVFTEKKKFTPTKPKKTVILESPKIMKEDPLIYSVSAQLLHTWLTTDGNIIIVDFRAQNDYQQCYINFPFCVNLPGEKVSSQKLTDYSVSDLLANHEDRVIFDGRFEVDFVVLMGYCGEQEMELLEGSPLMVVSLALTKYSSRDSFAKIGYLLGGFLDFADQYVHLLNIPLRKTKGFEENSHLYQGRSFLNGKCEKMVENHEKIGMPQNPIKIETFEPMEETTLSVISPESGKKTKNFFKSWGRSESDKKPKKPNSKQSPVEDSQIESNPFEDFAKQLVLSERPEKPANSPANANNDIKSKKKILPKIPSQSSLVENSEITKPKQSSLMSKVKSHSRQSSNTSVKVLNEVKDSDKLKSKNGRKRNPRGLRNIGNTCFMNAVIHCLNSVHRLSHYFMSEKFKKDINKDNKLGYKGDLAFLYHDLLVAVNSSDGCDLSPVKMRDFTAEHCGSYSKGEQHDSHEFLNFILDGLHEDLKRGVKDGPLLTARTKAEEVWRLHLRENQSIISDCFQGLLKSTIKCVTCSAESVTFDVFMFLALPMPDKPNCTLKDCLDEFCLVEELSGIYCDNCKVNGDAMKHVGIWRLPPTLIIFFMRFVYSNGRFKRKDSLVGFPLDDLGISAFQLDPSSGIPHYYLHAIVNHVGSLNSGHYTCDVIYDGEWYSFDDLDVRRLEYPSITKSAYILFYECCAVPKYNK